VTAPADGYTLLLAGPANVISMALYDKLNFNFTRDIAPIASIVRFPFVMEVHPSVPTKTLAEFMAYTKANPGKVNMASAGTGSGSHLTGELFKCMSSEHFGQLAWQFKRMSGSSGLKVQAAMAC